MPLRRLSIEPETKGKTIISPSKSEAFRMNNNKKAPLWLTLLLCATLGGQTSAADTGLTTLKQLHPPERQPPQSGLQRGISLNGSDTVQMQQGSFRLDPKFIPQLNAAQGYVLLQLTGPLNDEWRRQLEALQVKLLEYIPDNTWSSRVDRDQLQMIHALPFVRAIGKIYPSDKLPASLLANDLSPHALQGGLVTLDVSFQPDQPLAQVLAALRALGAAIEQEQNGFSSGQQLRVTLPVTRLLDLANLEAVRWIEEPAAPIMQNNVESANLIQVTALQQQLPDLLGTGVMIGGWESGAPQLDHPDLAGRITLAQGSATVDHTTHVTGTLIGSGKNNSQARGMAPGAHYVAYDFLGDIPMEMTQAITSYGVHLSNHSWGYMTGWTKDYYGQGWTWFGNPNEESDSNFGRYSSLTQQWDTFVSRYDSIVVKSVGNNRNDYGVPAGAAHHHLGDSVTLYYDGHKSDSGYDSLETVACAKNIISVGAVDGGGGMASFSGWGPTDDGRIKPDLVADGVGVLSTFPSSGYGVMSGTSMSTPAVTGALALLTELYDKTRHDKLGAATAKALLIHSATDLGAPGPDYQYGWGQVNANAAASIIRDDQNSGQHLRLESLTDSAELSYPVTIGDGSSELRATIAWSDPAGSPAAASALVNDLDLELIAPDGSVHYPFTLSGQADPAASARQDRANHLDNVEQVLVKSPQAGQWQIRVRGYRVHGSQEFTLISTSNISTTAKAVAASTSTSVPAESGGGGGSLGLLSLILLAIASLWERRQPRCEMCRG